MVIACKNENRKSLFDLCDAQLYYFDVFESVVNTFDNLNGVFFILRELFYTDLFTGKFRKYSIKTGATKDLGTETSNFRVYVDHVNQRLYYYGKTK